MPEQKGIRVKVLIFEDEVAGELSPLSLSRPVFTVGCGALSLYEAALRVFGGPVFWEARPFLEGYCRAELTSARFTGGETLFLNARVLPSLPGLEKLKVAVEKGQPLCLRRGGDLAAACLKADDAALGMRQAAQMAPAGEEVPEIELWKSPVDLVRAHARLLAGNLAVLVAGRDRLGPNTYIGPGVKVSRSAVFEDEGGTILLDEGAEVRALACLRGPAYVGRRALVLEHAFIREHSSIGERCKVGGEIDACNMEPYSNKQHQGFLGHSYVGSWVNIGAGTSNSDLKNTYGEVSVRLQGRKVPTGTQFFGCVIGDYAKTAINTSLFTGKIVGVSSHIYGVVSENVPSFCNYAKSMGGAVSSFDLEVALRIQERMFLRRGLAARECHKRLLRHAFEATAGERGGMPSGLLTF